MSQFYNPVQLFFGQGSLHKLAPLLAGKNVGILGTRGSLERGLETLAKQALAEAGAKSATFHRDVKPNPTVASATAGAEELRSAQVEVILAIGGGSTLDTAKAVAALLGPTWMNEPKALSMHLRESVPLPKTFEPLPILAVPTTAGTGSEVTPFATLWDETTGAKYSLNHPSLFPRAAAVDPALTLSLPRELTLFTGLDALSHALESLWNKSANSASRALAKSAVGDLLEYLPRALENPGDLNAREKVQNASVLSGMAISSTRTALAHSFSYPLTAQLDMPHGLACSFTLIELLKANGEAAPEASRHLLEALGVDSLEMGVRRLEEFFSKLGVFESLKRYAPAPEALSQVRGTLIHPGRADNAFARMDDSAARTLLVRAWNGLEKIHSRHP